MALNAFEQLEFFVPEPRRAFGEVIQTLLQDHFGDCVRQTSVADGRTHVAGTSPQRSEQVTLYQAKYFVGRWRSCQRKELRETFQRSLEGAQPFHRWVLCVPSRMAPEDVTWFEGWRASQEVRVEALDGNELIRMLKEPASRRALEKIQAWGTTVPGADSPRVQGRLKIRRAETRSGLTHYLHVFLYNGGGRAVKSLSVELAHSVTGCFRLRPDEKDWCAEGKADGNPRKFRACRPLNPMEERLLAVIPIGVQTPLPLGLRLRFTTEQTARVEQHLHLNQKLLKSAGPREFVPGAGPVLVLDDAGTLPGVAA